MKINKLKLALCLSMLVPLTNVYAAVEQQSVPPASVIIKDGIKISLPPLTTVISNDQINTASVAQQLKDQGCDPSVMKRLNDSYLFNRGLQRNIELQTLVGEQAASTPDAAKSPDANGSSGTSTSSTPGATQSCFQNAATKINTTIKQVNQVLSVLSGDFSGSGALDAVVEQAKQAACQQVNNATGQVVGNVTNPISNGIGGAVGTVTGAGVSTQYGGTTVGQVLTNGGINPYGTNTTASCTSIFNCNPFK